jgi:hypothetical protein
VISLVDESQSRANDVFNVRKLHVGAYFGSTTQVSFE